MKTQNIILRLFGCLPGLTGLILGPAWVQGAMRQVITWTGTPNEILALNAAYPLSANASSGLLVTFRVGSGPAVLTEGTPHRDGGGHDMGFGRTGRDSTYLPSRETRSFNVREALLSPVGGYYTEGTANGVQVIGNYAFMTAGGAGFQVIDVRNPASPIGVSQVYTRSQAEGVQVVGN